MKQMFAVLFIGLFSSAFAQDTPPLIDEENPDLAAQVDYILENLNMSSVTTNLLLDRGFKMNDISNYTGAASSNTLRNFDDWAATYMSLYTSSISSANPLGQLNNWTTLAEQHMANGVIPIMAFYAGYHQFLEDSVMRVIIHGLPHQA